MSHELSDLPTNRCYCMNAWRSDSSQVETHKRPAGGGERLEMNGRAILKTFNISLPLGTLCQALGYRGVSSMAKGVYPPSRWQMGHLANCRRVLSVLVNPVNQSRHFEFHIQDEIRLPCYLWRYFPNICDSPANKAWTHHDNV